MIPHEINNEFLIHVHWYTKEKETPWGNLGVWVSDFADVEFPPEKLDQIYHDFDVLEKNLDEIIKIVPLPPKIGVFDWYYIPWFISDATNLNDEVFWTKEFTKSDMLLIISLIKKKILEAKEKNQTLVFSGD
jgi:hypothetical protein